MSRVIALGLQNSTTTSYDQTKTTLQGRSRARTITDGNGPKVCLGVSPVVNIDVFDDTGVAPAVIHTTTQNGRIFIGKGIVGGNWIISYYSFDTTLGTQSWVGDIKLTLSTGTHTIKGFTVDDSNTASMTILWNTTSSTATTGGLFGAWGVNITDFSQGAPPTFPLATVASQSKAVWVMGDTATQAANTLTVSAAQGIDPILKDVYVLAGVSATPSIYKFSYSVPPTGSPTLGYTNSNFTLKTGTLAAFGGVILLNNCLVVATPNHSANAGFQCLCFITSTTLYFAKITDVTSAVVSLPSLTSSNAAISTDYLLPVLNQGQFSPVLDKFVVGSTSGPFFAKQQVNNDPNGLSFGYSSFIKSESGGMISPVDFGGNTIISCLSVMNGWAVLMSTGIGQRGLYCLDLYSDQSSTTSGQVNSSIITPVVSGNFSQGLHLGIYKEFAKRSVYPTIQYRTSNFSTGPGAGFDATWTTAPKDGDLSLLVNVPQVQFRFLFTVAGIDNTNASQIIEGYFVYTDYTQNSRNWVASINNTTANGASPTRYAFRLQSAYATSVPTMYFRAVDDSGNVVTTANTVTNAANFEYTTNNGTSWLPLGTISNTALTTELRYNFTSPPGVNVRGSLSES